MKRKIFILCGEVSGDLYAGRLIRNLRELCPDVDVYAMGGKECYLAGAQLVADPTSIAVVGVWEVLQHLTEFRYIYNTVKSHILDVKPDALVFIDFPGFNLRLARDLKRYLPKTKFFYYISPQIWAWGRHRVKFMRIMDGIFVIFPFEVDFYRGYGIEAEFVGHPLGEILSEMEVDEKLGKELKGEKRLITILPGSRLQEVTRHLPIMLGAAKRLVDRFNFCINQAPTVPKFVYESILQHVGISMPLLSSEKHPTSLSYADIVWVASGTATIQTMFYHQPMVVVYKVSPLTYWLLRPLVKVKYISMVNILADELLVPELIQSQFTSQRLIAETEQIISNPDKMRYIREKLSQIGENLFSSSTSKLVARKMLEYIGRG